MYTLSCGLRVIHERHASPVLYCGFLIHAGTRYEEPAEEGMAHFIEHMNFKGTDRRRSCHITNGLERVGGDLNAYTTKQEVVFYATVLKEDFRRAADLLCDMTFHSNYPQHEMDKEIEVICDEIDSYEDLPSDIIFDEFEALMYPGQGLGRDILGRKERLREYRTADALRFVRRLYNPHNAVFYVYGDIPFSQVVRTLESLLPASDFAADWQVPVLQPSAPRLEGLLQRKQKQTQQLHVMVGAPTFPAGDDRRFALLLLNNMLGGPGMNARLNIQMREKAGLVYSVNSSLNSYPDSGYWSVYFGCDAHDEKRCLKILRRELRRFIDAPLSPAQLAAAKKQLRGQVAISTDNAENYALAMAKTFAHFGTHRNIGRLLDKIALIRAEEVQTIAQEIYAADRLSTLMFY